MSDHLPNIKSMLGYILTSSKLLDDDSFYAQLAVAHPTIEAGVSISEFGPHRLGEDDLKIIQAIVAKGPQSHGSVAQGPAESPDKLLAEIEQEELIEERIIEEFERAAEQEMDAEEDGILAAVDAELALRPELVKKLSEKVNSSAPATPVMEATPGVEAPSTPDMPTSLLPQPSAPIRPRKTFLTDDLPKRCLWTPMCPIAVDPEAVYLDDECGDEEAAFWGYLPNTDRDNAESSTHAADHDEDEAPVTYGNSITKYTFVASNTQEADEDEVEVDERDVEIAEDIDQSSDDQLCSDHDSHDGEEGDSLEVDRDAELVSVPKLAILGIAYNKRYNLLICSTCREGHSPVSLFNHLKESEGKRICWVQSQKIGKNEKEEDRLAWQEYMVKFDHPPSGRFPSDVKEFESMIVGELKKAGYIESNDDIRSHRNWMKNSTSRSAEGVSWRNAADPADFPLVNGVRKPVAGLRIYQNSWACTVGGCSYVVPSRQVMYAHLRKDHPKKPRKDGKKQPPRAFMKTNIFAQTLSEVQSNKRYFEVVPNTSDLKRLDPPILSHNPLSSTSDPPTKTPPQPLSEEPTIMTGEDPLSDEALMQLNPDDEQLYNLLSSTNPEHPQYPKLLDKANTDHPRYLDFIAGNIAGQKGEVMDEIKLTPKSNQKAINEFLKDSRIDAQVHRISTPLQKRMLLPLKSDDSYHLYAILQKIVVRSFMDQLSLITRDVEPINPSILLMMTNTGRLSPFPRRPFHALSLRHSISGYARMEARFLWAMLRTIDNGSTTKRSQCPFTFTETQKQLLHKFADAIESQPDASSTSDLIGELLQSIYFPDETSKHIKDIFYSPIILFTALQFWDARKKCYRDPFHIPPDMTKVQYSVRLRSLGIIHGMVGEATSADDLQDSVSAWVQKYLGELSLQPFATVRQYLHEISVEVRDRKRPPIARWDGSDVVVAGKRFPFPLWKAYVQRRIRDLRTFVEKEVLLDLFTLPEIDRLFGSKLANVAGKVGQGVCFDATTPYFDTLESKTFMGRIYKAGALGVSRKAKQDGSNGFKFVFDKQRAIEWVHKIHRAWTMLYPLGFFLQGPGGRLTEEELYCPIETEALAANIFFNERLRTGGYYSRYHKGQRKTGRSKHIVRALPLSLFDILFILLRMVRPIELAAIFDHILPMERHAEAANAYKSSVFASLGTAWDPPFLSTVISLFVSEAGFGVTMNVREVRHFTIALQRHLLDPILDSSHNDVAEKLKRAANLMAAHSPEVAEAHYARLETTLGSADSDELFLKISQDWHLHVYGVKTSERENNEQRLERLRESEESQPITIRVPRPPKRRLPKAKVLVEENPSPATRPARKRKQVNYRAMEGYDDDA